MRSWIPGIFSTLFVLLTLLPLSRRPQWWIRGADFPRVQFSLFGIGLLTAMLLVSGRDAPTAFFAGVTLLAVVYQAWWIFPYTPLFPTEVKTATQAAQADRLSILSINVLMTNRRAGDLLRIVRAERPDVLVTLETNEWWERALGCLETDYPHTVKCPLENLYGMHLFSRLPLEDPKIQYLVQPDVPSIHTLLVLRSGRRVCLHCLHPAPPSPTENPTSRERDAELVMVGRSAARARFPVIVSGDLNDVAWSATTRLFRKVSGLLDPRVGRGMYNTYHAGHWFCRWPVDHFFHSAHFTFVRLERLPACGSDHFPVLIEVACEGGAAPGQEGLEADADDRLEAREKMQKKAVASSEVHRPGEGATRRARRDD
ncbi:MAG: endonuclease [Rariglobus sp.]|jgi:endonuclease/exonuclease/phosphatase (EEP) superfamily protein YafD|nr:endonuclease [Rariglobus sp.]